MGASSSASLPFGGFDAPPAIDRLLGLQWLARLLYPQVFDPPLGPRVKEFHRRFDHREPTNPEVSALLAGAGGLR
jgi:iron complex transport system substrate-binding protein